MPTDKQRDDEDRERVEDIIADSYLHDAFDMAPEPFRYWVKFTTKTGLYEHGFVNRKAAIDYAEQARKKMDILPSKILIVTQRFDPVAKVYKDTEESSIIVF